jgi:hypothetical protein
MGLFANLAAVRKARSDVDTARKQTVEPAAALIARGYENPLTVVGTAAGVGFLLSGVKLNPLAVPGVSGLVASGSADIIGRIVSIATGSFLGEMATGAADAGAAHAAEEPV